MTDAELVDKGLWLKYLITAMFTIAVIVVQVLQLHWKYLRARLSRTRAPAVRSDV